MILLDDRVGSKELLPLFKRYDVHVEPTHLDFADCCWPGNGPDGDCLIGLERKRISDLIQSMRTRRLSGHQLPGLLDTYAYVYVMVEGMYRPGQHGDLEEYKGWGKRAGWVSSGVMYREVDSYLSTLEMKLGIEAGRLIVRRTSTDIETVHQIVDLYKWWNDKAWDKHQSHVQMYAPGPDAQRRKWVRREPGIVEKMAAQLPGLDQKAWEVGKVFETPEEMVRASVRDWQRVKGVGKKLAERFVKELRG